MDAIGTNLVEKEMDKAIGRPLATRYACLCKALDLGVLVDEEDEHFLEEYRWRLTGNVQQVTATLWDGVHPGYVFLHQLVLGIQGDTKVYVKTRNGNWRDCRKSNLVVIPRKLPTKGTKYDGDYNYSGCGNIRPSGVVRQHEADGD